MRDQIVIPVINYGVASDDRYTANTETRSLLLEVLVALDFPVPMDSFESSEQIVTYLKSVIDDPFAARNEAV